MTHQGRPLIEFLGLDEPEPLQKGASLLVCAYRTVSVETCESLIALVMRGNWQYQIRHGDAWIGRARSVIASQWYQQTQESVFVMVDADIRFKPSDIELLAEQCDQMCDVVCADYPVHNGQFMAGMVYEPEHAVGHLQEMQAVATGCVAVHRRVLDALVTTMPLCHKGMPIAYWPFFISFLEDVDGVSVPLSEDYAFSLRARRAGFRLWRDTRLKVDHLSEFPLNVDNMDAMHKAGGLTW